MDVCIWQGLSCSMWDLPCALRDLFLAAHGHCVVGDCGGFLTTGPSGKTPGLSDLMGSFWQAAHG